MVSTFLKKNFKSMNEEDKDKEKFKKFNKKNKEFFDTYRKKIKGTISDEELELLKSVLPK